MRAWPDASVLDGLPELGEKTYSTASASVNKAHASAKIKLSTFNLLTVDQYVVQRTGRSAIWGNKRDTRLVYSTEEDISRFVQEVLRDAVSALPALQSVEVRIVPELSAFGEKADLWVLARLGVPVGVVEVKKPHEAILQNESVAGQLLDYMKRLRSFFGLSDIFGIATTYEEWRIFWLKDCDAAAASCSMTGATTSEAVPLQGVPDIPSWGGRDETPAMDIATSSPPTPVKDRLVHAGNVLRYNDPQLVPTLLSVLMKMVSSPVKRARNLVDPDREYIVVNSSSWFWTRLFGDFKINTRSAMPRTDATSFILLAHLGDGGFGRVWLAATHGGSLCVIKFGKDGTAWNPDHEALVWKSAWKLNARVLQLAGRRALLLPYLLTCQRAGPTGPDAVAVRLATVRAIERMAAAGWEHTDLARPDNDQPKWAHVGLYRQGGELKALLIDLGIVRKVLKSDVERAGAVARMRAALGLDDPSYDGTS